jgi:hypothetical protein
MMVMVEGNHYGCKLLPRCFSSGGFPSLKNELAVALDNVK